MLLGEMYFLTMPHDRPGSQVNRHPINSSTNETLTFIEFSAMRFSGKSPAVRTYKERATRAAAAAIDEELMFAAF